MRARRGIFTIAALLTVFQAATARGVTMTEAERQLVGHALTDLGVAPSVRDALGGASLRVGNVVFEGANQKILLVSVALIPRGAPPVSFTGFVTLSYRLDRAHARLIDPPSAELVVPLLRFAVGTEDKALALAHAKLETLPRYRDWLRQGWPVKTAATIFCPSGREDFWIIVYDVEGVTDQAVEISVDVRSGQVTNVSLG